MGNTTLAVTFEKPQADSIPQSPNCLFKKVGTLSSTDKKAPPRGGPQRGFHEDAERCQATPGRLMLRPPLRRCRGICETSRLKAAICALYLSCNLLVCWQLVFRGLAQRRLFERPTSPTAAAHHLEDGETGMGLAAMMRLMIE